MSNPLKSLVVDEIDVSETSWHFRVYKWWRQNSSGNKPGYRENLCHYMRVILLWAPLMWLFKGRVYGMYPWFTALCAGIIGYLGYGVVTNPENFIPFLIAVGVACVAMGILILAFIGLFYINDEVYPGIIGRFFGVWMKPLWIGPYFVLRGIGLLWQRVLTPWHEWAVESKITWVLSPLSVGLMLFPAVMAVIYGPTTGIGILIFYALIAVVCGILVGIIVGAVLLFEKIGDMRYKRRLINQEFAEPRKTSTVRIVVSWLMAQKRKICPFINVPEHVFGYS